MAKTVFTGEMLFHVWANQSAPHGRRTDGRVHFDGPTLYSYGRHFALGHVMPDGATLLNADSYSISTSKHQSQTARAARGRTYRVPNLTDLVHGYAFRADPANARDSIVRHVTENALRFPDDSAVYLLTLAKRPRAWPSIKAAAERARDKAKAAERARDIASRKGQAERMAAATDSEVADLIAARLESPAWGKFPTGRNWPKSEYRKATPSETVGAFATELHRLNVTAKAHCGKRVQAALSARLKAVRARAKRLAWLEEQGEKLATWGRVKADFRTLASAETRGELTRESAIRLGRLAGYLAHNGRGLVNVTALTAIVATMEEREAAAVARDNAERMEREAAARAAWLAGEGPRYWRGSDETGAALLRATGVERDAAGAIVAGTLETSHGADVPLPHALRAFAFVRRVVATGEGWHANGHTIRVGHFRVDAISPDGTMRAGCHTIRLAEMERLATALGVADVAPSDAALELTKGAA